MECSIIRRQDCPTGHWSGGSTTELFVWPSASSYAARNFSLRVSTAVVEADSSVFTLLPDITRILMAVQGDMRLQIEGQGDISLSPWQSVRFDGGVKTVSFGRCVDFGLMLGQGWDGSLQAVASGKYSCHSSGFTGVYSPVGSAAAVVESPGVPDFQAQLEAGDLLMVQRGARVTVQSNETVILFTAFPIA